MKSLLKKVFIGIPLAGLMIVMIYLLLFVIVGLAGSLWSLIPVTAILFIGYVLIQLLDVLIG